MPGCKGHGLGDEEGRKKVMKKLIMIIILMNVTCLVLAGYVEFGVTGSYVLKNCDFYRKAFAEVHESERQGYEVCVSNYNPVFGGFFFGGRDKITDNVFYSSVIRVTGMYQYSVLMKKTTETETIERNFVNAFGYLDACFDLGYILNPNDDFMVSAIVGSGVGVSFNSVSGNDSVSDLHGYMGSGYYSSLITYVLLESIAVELAYRFHNEKETIVYLQAGYQKHTDSVSIRLGGAQCF